MTEQESSGRNWLGVLKKSGILIAILAVFLFLVWIGFSKYGDWRFEKDIQALIETRNRPYLEDTYGGKTPKETLELFISAVEKGDFDLASKYFVLSKQEEWKERLVKGEKQKLDNWIYSLKTAQDRGSLWEDNFQMEIKNNKDDINLIIDFIKYPRGIWKIQEI